MGENFDITYSYLGIQNRTVRYATRADSNYTCVVLETQQPCDAYELPLLPPPPRWAMRFLLYFPMPVPEGDDTVELGCVC